VVDLTGKAKERSIGMESTMLRCSTIEATTPRKITIGGLECVVEDAATKVSGG
jgi:hypothetical protein